MSYQPVFYIELDDVIFEIEKTQIQITERGTIQSSDFIFHIQTKDDYIKLSFTTETALFFARLLNYAVEFATNTFLNSPGPARHYKLHLKHDKIRTITVQAFPSDVRIILIGSTDMIEIHMPLIDANWLSEVLHYEALREYANLSETQQVLYDEICKKKEEDGMGGREFG